MDKVYNMSVLLDPRGAIVARYRKVHLFDIAVGDHVEANESAITNPGSEVMHAETPMATIGLSICYDLRFPELYRTLALRGAELVVSPAPSPSTTTAGVRDLAVWRSRTRGGHRSMISGCVDSRRPGSGRGPKHRPWSLADGVRWVVGADRVSVRASGVASVGAGCGRGVDVGVGGEELLDGG